MPARELLQDYPAFLRSRWPARTRALAKWAAGGTLLYALLDVVFTRALPEPAALGTIAAARLPWLLAPIAGWLLARRAPGWGGLPAAVVALATAWTLGNDWAFFALGLAGTVVQSLALVVGFATATTLLPLALRGRLAVFALMGIGHVALDLAWPQAQSLALRLWTDGAILVCVASQAFVFEHFARSQRRGFQLRLDLERTVAALEASRERAAAAAAAVGRLAAEVAHEVNNPLAAVKVNLRLLGDPASPAAEREETARDALQAVERISRIVADLRLQALAHRGLLEEQLPVPTPPAGR